jgi:hypothetical protein
MTECTTQTLEFSSIRRQKILADFDGGRISSDAGVLLLRQTDQILGLIDAIDDCIPDPRNPIYTTHAQRTLLAQRIFAIAAGSEDLNDHQTLRDDPAFQIATGRGLDDEQPLASPPTLCRLENRIDRKTLARMADVFVEQFIASYSSAPEEIILDFDATDDPVHGAQAERFFHGYYDHYCFLPLYVFCGHQLLVPYLRPANIDAAKHSRAILKLLVRRFRQVWPNVRIVFRGDSGFCRWRLMRWCDRHGVQYIIGLAKNAVLQRMARREIVTARWRHRRTGHKQRIFGEVTYAAKTWDCPRRVIVKAEHTDHGANPRFVVTNMPGQPQDLYDTVYCQRGNMENRIKEQQLGLFADRTSCHDFLANQFRLMLSSAAYVLVDGLRRLALVGTEMATAQVQTIRVKLLKVGARVKASVRRVVFHLASGYPLQQLFRRVAARLQTLLAAQAASRHPATAGIRSP